MLKRMRLKNFKCFDDITLDLSGPRGKPERCALIYGENGSGKTNMVLALAFLRSTLHTLEADRSAGGYGQTGDPWFPETLRGMHAALRARGRSGPMSLEYTFTIDNKDAVYEISISESGLLEKEKLIYAMNGRKAVLFAIENGEKNISNAFSKEFAEDISWDIAKLWGVNTLLAIIESKFSSFNESFLEDTVDGGILRFLRYVEDLDIHLPNRGSQSPDPLDNLGKGTSPRELEPSLDAAAEALDDFFCSLYSDIEGVSYMKSYSGNSISYELSFEKRIEGRTVNIPFSEESSGTKRLVGEFIHIMRCVGGGVVIIDEMDSGIHDLLMAEVFRAMGASMKGQFIATTHNTLLLQESNPRGSFIIDMDAEGRRTVKSIHSIARTQKMNNNTRRYLKGEFGGIPITGYSDLEDIGRRFADRVGGGA